MKTSSSLKEGTAPGESNAEQLVLHAYLHATKDPAFRAFAKRVLVPGPKRRKK